MYSGRQPSGSISKWVILVAFFIFHAVERVETTQNECSDEVVDCDNDMSICTEPEFNDFANANCKATCGRCAPSSSTTSTISSSTKTTTTPTSTTVTTEQTTTKPTTTVATTVVTTTTEKATTQPIVGIGPELSCTQFNGVKMVYTEAAFSCKNENGDALCSVYKSTGYPGPGNDDARPTGCYSLDGQAIRPEVRSIGINQCAKTCGYCCLSLSPVPGLPSQPTMTLGIGPETSCTVYNGFKHVYTREAVSCRNNRDDSDCIKWYGPIWPDEGNDVPRPLKCYTNVVNGQIMNNLKNAANKLCPRTCGYCCLPKDEISPAPCTHYAADLHKDCPIWAKNGHCTNPFYKNKGFCDTTCKVCSGKANFAMT